MIRKGALQYENNTGGKKEFKIKEVGMYVAFIVILARQFQSCRVEHFA